LRELLVLVRARTRLLLTFRRRRRRLRALLHVRLRGRRVRRRRRVDVRVCSGGVHRRALHEREERGELCGIELQERVCAIAHTRTCGPRATGGGGDLPVRVVRGEEPRAEDGGGVRGGRSVAEVR
jgi:hypothetical protein